MKISFLLVSAIMLSCGASSQAQLAPKPKSPRASQQAVVKQLRQQLSSLKAKRQKLLQEYFPDSPEIRQVESQIASLEQRLKRGKPQPTNPVRLRGKFQLLSP